MRDSHLTCLYSWPIDQTTVTLCAMQHQDHLWLAFRHAWVSRKQLIPIEELNYNWSFSPQWLLLFFPKDSLSWFFYDRLFCVSYENKTWPAFPFERNVLFSCKTFHTGIFSECWHVVAKMSLFAQKSKYIPFGDVSNVFFILQYSSVLVQHHIFCVLYCKDMHC